MSVVKTGEKKTNWKLIVGLGEKCKPQNQTKNNCKTGLGERRNIVMLVTQSETLVVVIVSPCLFNKMFLCVFPHPKIKRGGHCAHLE